MIPYFSGFLWVTYQAVPIMSPSTVIPNIPELFQTQSMEITLFVERGGRSLKKGACYILKCSLVMCTKNLILATALPIVKILLFKYIC